MILMGDEMGRTQLGNNNAYCQNNRSTWVDWERGNNFSDITEFTKNMIKLRKKYNIFRNQLGNNNAYCQNNRSTWVDWERGNNFSDITEFTKNMIKLRKKYNIFRNRDYLELEDNKNKGVGIHGVKLNCPDFSYYSLSIAFSLYDSNSDTTFYIILNSYHGELNFELPNSILF